MTDTQEFIVMSFGALVALAGLTLLFQSKKKSEKADKKPTKDESKDSGKSRIEILGFKFEMSTPGLAVFLVGCAIFVMPFFLERQQTEPQNNTLTKAQILHEYQGSSISNHKLKLTSLVAKSRRIPPKVNDLFTIEFTLKNVGDVPIRFDETFVAARNPQEFNKDFGHSNQGKTLAPSEGISVRVEEVLNAAGNWRFWPCYTLIIPEVSEEETYCPSRWESFIVEVKK